MLKKTVYWTALGGLCLGLTACGSTGGENVKNVMDNINHHHDHTGINMDNTPPHKNDPKKITPPPAPVAAEIQKAVEYTNQLRKEKGLAPLKYDPKLAAYAQLRAHEIVKKFSHDRPNGQSYSSEVKGGSGENIAAGHGTAQKTVLEQWRKSKGHYNNMVNANYQTIGIGMVHIPNSKYGYYWVQIFGFLGTTTDYSFDTQSTERSAFRSNDKVAANPQALTHLLVNDTAIPLLSDGKSVWNDIQFKNYEGVAGYLPNSRFGVVKQRDEHQYTPFHQGLITPVEQMPRKGKATYSGYAVATRGQEVNRNLAAQFTADFDRKRVDGALSEQGKNVFKINADIEENRFKSAESATVHTQGGFFGTHANEISGVFHEPRSDWRGAFGATQ